MVFILFGFLFFAAAAIVLLFQRLRGLGSRHSVLNQENETLAKEHAELKDRFKGILDVEAEKRRILEEAEAQRRQVLEAQEAERARLQKDISQAQAEKQLILTSLDNEKQRVHDELEAEARRARSEVEAANLRWRGELDAEKTRLLSDMVRFKEEQQQAIHTLQEQRRMAEAVKFNLELNISKLRADQKELDEEANLRSFGFYKPRYDFTSSERFQQKLEEVRERQRWMLKNKTAAICHTEWAVNGSKTEGRKQINQTLKLLLRAFNGECDAAIARVRYNNANVMEARIIKAFEMINALAEVQMCRIAREYLNFKLEELYLTHEYQEKVQDEKEEQRRIREQMREEEIAQRELERAQIEAEKEEKRYAESLRKASEEVERAVGDKQQRLLGQIGELQRRLEEAQTKKERAIARAQMTRSGHVYVISNVGSFGEQVYKIGMTRRLDPLDRVRELGDASVPFHFDVHAIIYSEDAPALECALHRAFHHCRVNQVNHRKEFFRVSIDEIAEAVRQHHGEIEITQSAEAVEYRKTLALLQNNHAAPATAIAAYAATT